MLAKERDRLSKKAQKDDYRAYLDRCNRNGTKPESIEIYLTMAADFNSTKGRSPLSSFDEKLQALGLLNPDRVRHYISMYSGEGKR